MTRFIGTATGSKPEKIRETGGPEFVVQMTPAPAPRKEMIAIGGQWNALPRVPRLAGTDQEIYKEAVADFLEKKGIKNIASSDSDFKIINNIVLWSPDLKVH